MSDERRQSEDSDLLREAASLLDARRGSGTQDWREAVERWFGRFVTEEEGLNAEDSGLDTGLDAV